MASALAIHGGPPTITLPDDGRVVFLIHCPNKPFYNRDALTVSEAARQNLVRVPTLAAASRELLDQYIAAFRKQGRWG